jgi:hypothetical protein
MPYYEYRCPTNGRTVEVRHGMGERLTTWAELAAAAGVDAGGTPGDAAVERLMSVAAVATGSGAATGSGPAPTGGCGAGCGCAHRA